VHVKLRGDLIEDVSFEGAGCAISKASASVMTTAVKGRTLAEAEKIFQEFHDLVRGMTVTDDDLERLGRLAAFSGVSEFPARVKCASLPWHTLRGALHATGERVTTE
jgi:nitrogen fixation NifU-like protein